MVEFVWFPELALPLDPDEGEESYEDMFVDGVGHPFYQMNEPSVSVLEKLQENGPMDPEDDPNSWYNYDLVKDFWEEGDVNESRSKRVYPFDPAIKPWKRAVSANRQDIDSFCEQENQNVVFVGDAVLPECGMSATREFQNMLKDKISSRQEPWDYSWPCDEPIDQVDLPIR